MTIFKLKNIPYLALLTALRPINFLPFTAQIQIGRLLGKILYLSLKHRRHIAKVNIDLCFSSITEPERAKLVKRIFEQNGIGVIETAMAWWSDPSAFEDRVSFAGLENIESALQKGKGVILLGGHYSTLDLGGLLVAQKFALHAMYRPHNNAMMERTIRQGRLRCLKSLIHRSDFRTVVKTLRSNQIVWYAPDQDFGPRHSVFAKFFGIEAATVTVTERLAKISGAAVIPIAHHRKSNRYEVRFYPDISPLMGEDEILSAQAVNDALERGILIDPSQYMWVHRRFKTQQNLPSGALYNK